MTRERQAQLLESADRYLVHNYKPQPIVMTRGEALRLWDVAGNRYLDMTAGIAACTLGHAHPKLAHAIAEQARRLLHVSNLFFIEGQIRLAERLAELAAPSMGPVRSFFCNSGAEANEAAIKLAKRYQTTTRGQGERIEVLSFEGSFHGRSIATVGLTGQEKYRAGFGPLIEWGRFLQWPSEGDFSCLTQITERTCAVILEPIQAEGGIRVPPPGFLLALRHRCTEKGVVLIFDEVQTGVGRTGGWFGHQVEPGGGVYPDVMSLAKGLAGGVPIGAMVARDEVAAGFAPGSHASTFGGNPLACAAALTVLQVIEEDRLLENVLQVGEHLGKKLGELAARYGAKASATTTSGRRAIGVRGRGLLRGLALDGDATPLVQKARERGLLLSVAGGTVIRFAPALLVTAAEIDEAIDILDAVLAS